MAPLVDYDDHQHHVYRRARELPADTVAQRMAWFRRHVGDVARDPILDLGCGTGRFAAPLASTFATTVIGVNRPSECCTRHDRPPMTDELR